MERLDKIVASMTGGSRKDARGMVLRGRVSVNGKVSGNIAQKVDPKTDDISVDGQSLTYKKYVYIMINKPKGILSASNDKSRETVVDLVKPDFPRDGLFPVGRLDKDTTGLLIITDDGDFGHKVISPKSLIEKEYLVTLDKPITAEDIKVLEAGVTLADGTVCRPAKVRQTEREKVVSMTITEGKYHEIKRMLGVVGIGVNELERIRIGSLCKDDKLDVGQYRELTEEDLSLVWK
ncbi:MAG: rRNA pseudouridine synthase [Clostridia bacterium]|nr:rRNA pseudouridine synthase [Clostridia bacterium]